MNKYTYIILVLAIAIVSGTFWYTSPTQQWERQVKLYQDKINSYSGDIIKISDGIELKIKQMEELSGSIIQDKDLINIKADKIKKLDLCIRSHSIDCDKAEPLALLNLIPQANATIE